MPPQEESGKENIDYFTTFSNTPEGKDYLQELDQGQINAFMKSMENNAEFTALVNTSRGRELIQECNDDQIYSFANTMKDNPDFTDFASIPKNQAVLLKLSRKTIEELMDKMNKKMAKDFEKKAEIGKNINSAELSALIKYEILKY